MFAGSWSSSQTVVVSNSLAESGDRYSDHLDQFQPIVITTQDRTNEFQAVIKSFKGSKVITTAFAHHVPEVKNIAYSLTA